MGSTARASTRRPAHPSSNGQRRTQLAARDLAVPGLPEVPGCRRCGALIIDMHAHVAFHDSLRQLWDGRR